MLLHSDACVGEYHLEQGHRDREAASLLQQGCGDVLLILSVQPFKSATAGERVEDGPLHVAVVQALHQADESPQLEPGAAWQLQDSPKVILRRLLLVKLQQQLRATQEDTSRDFSRVDQLTKEVYRFRQSPLLAAHLAHQIKNFGVLRVPFEDLIPGFPKFPRDPPERMTRRCQPVWPAEHLSQVVDDCLPIFDILQDNPFLELFVLLRQPAIGASRVKMVWLSRARLS